MTQLALGTTDSTGQFSATLNTGLIDPSEFGDIGDGVPDAFNVVIEALDQNGNFAFQDETLTLGENYVGSVSTATGGVQPVSGPPTLFSDGVPIGHTYRYVPVEPDNAAPGMQTVDTYTTTSSINKQTQVTVGLVNQDGGVMPRYKRVGSVAVALTAMSLMLADCGTTGGNALVRGVPTRIGSKAVRPGTEIGLLYVFLQNKSNSTIVLSSVGIRGPGIGRVVRLVQVDIAPLRNGRHHLLPNSVPSSQYPTDPPVFWEHGHCRKQALVPVKGFRMTPGSNAWLWVVLRAVKPGRWKIPFHTIYYTMNGGKNQQSIPISAYGSVSKDAAYLPPYYAMAKCVGPQTGARFLPGFHAGKVSR